ncbi:MAG TPA: hypothetical protein VN310_04815 [Candidatus Dormibacteraeota bacterium]|jgi:hypothetical protein|nr:hypothetical protein [Candidatus Dormibacteraeota bacterium]
MLSRVRWRAVLPAVNLAVFIALAAWGAQPVLQAALTQEGGVPEGKFSWTFENPEYPLLPLARRIAVAVNAPSYALSALMVRAVGASNERFASAVLFTMPPFVVLFWYLTGRWVDRRTGNHPVVVQPRRRLALLKSSAVVAGLVLALFAFRTEYFLTGGIAGWHGETPVVAAATYGFTGWFSLWEVMLIAAAVRCGESDRLTAARAD